MLNSGQIFVNLIIPHRIIQKEQKRAPGGIVLIHKVKEINETDNDIYATDIQLEIRLSGRDSLDVCGIHLRSVGDEVQRRSQSGSVFGSEYRLFRHNHILSSAVQDEESAGTVGTSRLYRLL